MRILSLVTFAVLVGCVSPPDTNVVNQHSDTTCVETPLAPDDPDQDLVAQCHYQQTYDATAAYSPPNANRVTCDVYPGLVACNLYWFDTQGSCRVVSCSYSNSDGLVCSPVGTTFASYCS